MNYIALIILTIMLAGCSKQSEKPAPSGSEPKATQHEQPITTTGIAAEQPTDLIAVQPKPEMPPPLDLNLPVLEAEGTAGITQETYIEEHQARFPDLFEQKAEERRLRVYGAPLLNFDAGYKRMPKLEGVDVGVEVKVD